MANSSSLFLVLLVLAPLCAVQAQFKLFHMRASGLPSDFFGIADGYVEVYFGATYLGKTQVRHNQVNPWWEETFEYYNAQPGDILRLEVMDEDLFSDDHLGSCQRAIQPGTHTHDCYLEEGVLTYSYTLKY